jgi:hypothetical protein
MFPKVGALKHPLPYEILGRIREHFVGRVVTLAAATAFNALLSVALLPLATRHLEASDYGIYGLVISIVILVSAAADGGAGLLVPAHYGSASESERARLFVSLAPFAGIAASVAGLLMIVPWFWHHGPSSDQPIPLATVALSAALMPMRAITNIAVMIFSVTDRGLAIPAQLAIQSLAMFLSTLIALFEFEMGVTSSARSAGSSRHWASVSSRSDVTTYRHGRHATGSAAPLAPRRPRQRPGSSMGPAGLVKMRYSQARSVCMRLAFWAMHASITAS